jgi:8-oxo-dGTP pyrophosphatase MutT (NUDIX family)
MTYLYSRACPSHEEGLALLRAAAEEAGLDLDLEVVAVRSDEDAERLGFPGSPTYLAAGRDLFPREDLGAAPTVDACRAYVRPGGRIGPLPHHDDVAAALRRAARRAPA